MYTSKLTGYKFEISFDSKTRKFEYRYFDPNNVETINPYWHHLQKIETSENHPDKKHEVRVIKSHAELNVAFSKWYHNHTNIPCAAAQIKNTCPELYEALERFRTRSSYLEIQNMSDEELLDVYLESQSGWRKDACSILRVVDAIRSISRNYLPIS